MKYHNYGTYFIRQPNKGLIQLNRTCFAVCTKGQNEFIHFNLRFYFSSSRVGQKQFQITSVSTRPSFQSALRRVINAGAKNEIEKTAKLTYIVLYNILKEAVNDRHPSCGQKVQKSQFSQQCEMSVTNFGNYLEQRENDV